MAVCGSQQAREQLGHMFFASKENGGEDWHTVGNYHSINDVGFETVVGRPVYMYAGDTGLDLMNTIGRFVGIQPRS